MSEAGRDVKVRCSEHGSRETSLSRIQWNGLKAKGLAYGEPVNQERNSGSRLQQDSAKGKAFVQPFLEPSRRKQVMVTSGRFGYKE